MTDIALGASDIWKSYGPVQANRGISLEVAPGQIHAIVGENGAGKSTLMRMLQGLERPDRGHVIVNDAPVQFSGPAEALGLGIGMVHQEFMLAPELTLLENLVLGDEPVRGGFGPLARIDWTKAEAQGRELADRIGIEVDWHRRAGTAPVHIQQFVEIIRLLRRGTRILILDEPTAVLAPQQVNELFDLLRRIRDDGTTILFISHKIREVTALADRVTVIRQGALAFSATIADTSGEEIAGHIVDGAPPERDSTPRKTPGAPVFRVRGLNAPSINKSQALHAIDFEVRAGEIVGLAGVAGNGQVELMEALIGLRRAQGRVTLHDTDLSGTGTKARRQAGIGFISEDRRHEGLAMAASIEDNVVAGSQRSAPIGRGWWLNRRALRAEAGARLARLAVRFGRQRDPISSLSGGNQQRVVFAREIASSPPLLLVSQPTRGVDLNGIAAIHGILEDFRAQGGAVLLASEELDELQILADRILVMADGRLVGEVAADADRRQIGRMMVMEGAQ
ncbi:ABC transporter ATP-binding protein [Pararhodobacter sp.]|uniref:ABC transporter ATP-binding protein n=1 Tax=Pararhodobacter sp. TaxID=2127056 RepID=UPI002AFF612E|nr:ABC transporter ATP-binding protein [Pararhodobacter sp.]